MLIAQCIVLNMIIGVEFDKWQRSTGFPVNERLVYQHSWLDLNDTDEEEVLEDAESDENDWKSPY